MADDAVPVSNLTLNKKVLYNAMLKSRKKSDTEFIKDVDLVITSAWCAGQMQGAMETAQYAGINELMENPLELLGVLEYITEKVESEMDDPSEWEKFTRELNKQKTTSDKVD